MKRNEINMKTQMISILVLSIMALTTFDSSARPPRPRHKCGVIENINHENQTLKLKLVDEEKTLEFVLKKRTVVIRNSTFDTVTSLKKGMHVCVYYRSPFFGKPFLTRIIWNDSTAHTGQVEHHGPTLKMSRLGFESSWE